MTVPIDATHRIDAYKSGQILLGLWFRGVAAFQMDLDIFKARMARGEVDFVYVFDLRDPVNNYKLYPGGVRVTLK